MKRLATGDIPGVFHEIRQTVGENPRGIPHLIQSTPTRRFAWKIGNNIHYVVCGCIVSQHMGYMRPLQAILYVADHKYANTWYFAHEYYRYDARRAALSLANIG